MNKILTHLLKTTVRHELVRMLNDDGRNTTKKYLTSRTSRPSRSTSVCQNAFVVCVVVSQCLASDSIKVGLCQLNMTTSC